MATTLYVGSGEEYKTLQAAVDAAGNGDTIVLKENVSETSVTIDGKELSIDLGNFTFTGHTYIKNNAAVSISNGKMTVEGTSPAFNAAVITVLNNEVGNDSSSLSLDGVIVDGGEAVNSRYYTHAVTYNAIGGLTVKNSTLTAGTATRNAECGSIGSNSSTAIGIYASNKSGGAIVIENSTINGGYGKTDAEWTGYVSQLFSPGGYAISLHGATDVTITDSAVNGGGSNWYNAAMAINVSNQFEGTLEIEKSEITGGNAEGAVGNYGSGGVAIYTHMATSCEKISVSGSTITGGAGGKSSNGSGIEYRNSNVEMSITDSTVAAGDGEKASGNGAAIAIYNASETQLVLDEVQLNGDGNGSNTVIKGGAAGVTLAGPVEIIGGELTNTTIIVDAENLEGSEMIISGNVGDGNDFSISGNDKAGIVVENGKTYVTTETDPDEADTSTLYCNSAWAGKSENELVGIGKFYGVNAFDSFRNAIAAADSNSSVARIEIESDITETTTEELFDITQHLTIGAASAVKVTLNGANLNIYQRGHNSSVTIEENVTISGAGVVANGFATSGNDLVIDGTLEAYTLKQWTSNGTITVSKTGKVALGFGDGQFDMAYGNGVVNVTGSLADTKDESLVDGPQFRAGYSGTRGTGNILNLTDTYFEAGRDFSLKGTDGTVNASNSVLKISGGDFQGILLMEKSGNAVNLNEGSRLIVVNVTIGENNKLNVADSSVEVENITNNGTFTVAGESTLDIAAVSGNGWIYMDNATLNADTRIQGGKVRFTNGTSTLSGAVLNTSAFQVGIGAYEAVDGRENVENVVVNVNDNSYIHAVDADYYGWVGTGWFENDADKAAGMTDARYTLNINNSVAEFGYFHVSTDGILNVTGNAGEKKSYTGVSYSYYGGRTMINGVATFDNVDALVQFTNVSCDNGTDAPGKLVIKNGANYVSWLDHSGTIASFQISKTGIVEVDNATLDARHGTLIAEDASLTVKNNGTFKGKAVTNNGTITVDGAQFTAASLTNQGTVLMDEGSTISFETLVNTGTINITIDAANLTEGVYSLIDMTGDNALDLTGINVTIGAETKALEQLLSNGSYVINDDYAMLQTGNDLAIYKVAQDVIYVDAAYAGLDAGTIVDGRIVGINAFADTKAALSAANSSGGADIVLENVANDDQKSEFALTEAGTYTVTGGNGAVFTPLLVNGADITLKFDKAFITLGKLRGGKDAAGYTKSSIEVTDSVIASNSYAGYGGGWATFYDCAVTINNSIYGINLNKYADALELPRSAADVKAAVSEDKYAYASGSGYDGQHIGTVGSLDIDGSTVFTGFFSVADRGYADIDNSVIYICGGLGIGDGMIQNGNDSNNSGWSSTSAEDFRVGSAAAMDIDNSIVRNITLNGEGGGLQVGSDSKAGVLNIKGSEFDFTAKGESSDVAVIYGNGTVNVADSVFKVGTLTNKGTFNAEDSTLVFGTFTQDSATCAIFNNVDLTADSFVNGDGNSDNYAVVGGTSKLNIANLSGYFALRLADGVVLKGGTSVDGSNSLCSLGDATFGEKADDKLYICSYDNNNCGGITLTVNGTLDISEEGKGYPTYWFGITGDQSGTDDAKTLLTGAGTVNVNTSAIFQLGTIVIDEELTINVTDVYAGNLNLTKADVTLKGKLIGTGSRNKLSAFNDANLTVTGENAAFALDSYLLVGYATYKGNNDTTNEYKSIVNVEDGAKFAVAGDIYVNLESRINIKDSSFTAGSNIHNLGVITVGGTSTVVIKNLNGDINFAEEGAVLTDDSSIRVSGNINAAGDLSFFWNDLSASGSMSVAGTLAIDGVQLDEATTVIYSGAVSFGSLVINGSKVLDNTIVVDGKMYDVAAGANGINVTVKEEVEVSEVTFTVNSITQAEGTYAFTFDITAQGGNTGDEYIYSVTAFDMNGNEIAGTFKDMVFTFADPAESNWVKFNVTVSDAYGESTATYEITNKEVADCTAPWFEADVTASAVKDENGLYNVMDISFNAADNFAVVGYIITVNGEEFTLLGTEHKYSYKTDVTGSCTYTVTAFDAAGNEVTSAEQSVDLYAGMKEDAKGISRIDGTGFAVDAVVSNGFGAYTYEIISVVEGETALKYESDGLNFTLADVPVKGELTVTVKVTDEKQNEYTFEVSGAVTDDEAPVITVDAFSTDWTNENVTITASASDNYGAVTFEYKIDDGEWITYVDGVVVDHNKAVVTFKATDAYGNVTEKEITVENIDKDVPTLTISGNPAEWTNKEVTLTASSNEADGVIEYFNGTEWVAGSTLKVSENGTYKFRVTDKGGNTVESEVVVDKIDMVQPALEVSGGSADWSNKEVILTVTTGEDASGIKSVEYSVNGGEFSAVADGKIEFNENGEYKVVVKVTDNAGNVTTSEEQTVLIDKTAPAVEISGGSEDWSNKEVVLNVTTGEDASGIKSVEYSVNSGEFSAVADGKIEFNENGEYKVVVKVTDNAGNETISEEQTVLIDKTAPVIAVSGNASAWTSENVTLDVTVEDITSTRIEYQIGEGEWLVSEDGKIVVDANAAVNVKVTDAAGNVSEETILVDKIDKLDPRLEIEVAPTDEMTNGNVTVIVKASDDVSGIASLRYSFNGTEWSDYTGDITVEENTVIYFETTDNAGKITKEEINVSNIDKVAPDAPAASADKTELTNETVTVTATFGDAVIKEYSFNGTDWFAYTDGVRMTENGTVYFRGIDAAGNVSETSEFTVSNIDAAADNADTVFVYINAAYSSDKKLGAVNGVQLVYGENAFASVEDAQKALNDLENVRFVTVESKTTIDSSDDLSRVEGITGATAATTTKGDTYKSNITSKGTVSISGADASETDVHNFKNVSVNMDAVVDSIDGGKASTTKVDKGTSGSYKFADAATGKISVVNATVNEIINYSSIEIDMDAKVGTVINESVTTSDSFKVSGDKRTVTLSTAAKAAGTLTISGKSTVVDSVEGVATVKITDSEVGEVVRSVKSQACGTAKQTFKVSGKSATLEESFTADRSGKFTIASVNSKAVVGAVSGYNTVTINGAETGSITNDLLAKRTAKYQQTGDNFGTGYEINFDVETAVLLSKLEEYSASGSVTLTGTSAAGDVTGYNKVTAKGEGSIGKIAALTGSDIVAGSVKVQTTADVAKGTVTTTETIGSAASVNLEGYTAEAVAGYKSVTLTNAAVTGDVNFGEAAKKVTDAKGDTAITYTRNGSLKAAGSRIGGSILNYNTVTLDGSTVAGDITNTLAAKSTISAAGVMKAENKLSGSVTLKADAVVEGTIANYSSVTLSDADVEAVKNVAKVTVKAGVNEISSFTGTEGKDSFTVSKGAVLTLNAADFGAGSDTLNVAGTLVLTGTEILNLESITGKGEIAAAADIFDAVKELVGKEFKGTLVNLGATAEGYRGLAAETADNSEKKAAKWDGEEDLAGWLGNGDSVDYIKFSADEGATLTIAGLADDCISFVGGNVEFANGAASLAAGEYILKLEHKEDDSVSYSIALS